MLIKLNLQRFAPAIAFITINFDSHISKVTYSGVEWTASGQSQQTAIVDGSTGVFTITLDSGYVLDTVTLGSDFDNTTLSAKTDTSFSLLFGNTAGGTITITSKKATSQVSIDLTTLSGWGNVADGEHNIQVVAKADGYRDSEKSTAVSFTKGSATVTLSAGTYRFNEEIAFEANVSYDENIVGKCNTLTDNDTYGGQLEFNNIYAYSDDVNYELGIIIDDVKEIRYSTTGDYRWFYYIAGEDTSSSFEYHATDTTKLRTIIIETDQQVSQEFKIWFTANTNVVTGHTLTSSSITPNNIEVNGTALTSLPYTLQNGDTIQVTYTLDGSAITVNGVKQTSNYQTYNLVNTDIVVEAVDGNIEFPSVTINYSNSASGGNIQ